MQDNVLAQQEFFLHQKSNSDAKFAIKNEYTIEDYAAYWLAFRWKSAGKKPPQQVSPRTSRVASCLLMVCGVATSIFCLWWRPSNFIACIVFSLLFFAVGVFGTVQGVPKYPRWVQRAWKNYQDQRWTYLGVYFGEHDFEICSSNQAGNSDCRYSYSVIQQLWEDEGHFYIDMGFTGQYMLQKSGFVKGDSADFGRFLEEKVGKPVKWVNGQRPL